MAAYNCDNTWSCIVFYVLYKEVTLFPVLQEIPVLVSQVLLLLIYMHKSYSADHVLM